MTNKITIEEKKLIAEKVHGCISDMMTPEHFTHEGKGIYTFFKDFNPDQDLTQFVEMIGALDSKLKRVVEVQLIANFPELDLCDNVFEDFVWLCKHKYEVCKAVIEVVKQKETTK